MFLRHWSIWSWEERGTKGYFCIIKRVIYHILCHIQAIFGHTFHLKVASLPIHSACLGNWFIILIWSFLIQELSQAARFLNNFHALLFWLSVPKFIEVFNCTDWGSRSNVSLVYLVVWVLLCEFGSLLKLEQVTVAGIIMFSITGFRVSRWRIHDVITLIGFVIFIWKFFIIAKIRLFVITINIWKYYWLLTSSLHLSLGMVISKDCLNCVLKILVALAKANEFRHSHFWWTSLYGFLLEVIHLFISKK